MDKICVLDFGAQYSQLIARRIRELSVYSEIVPCTEPAEKVLAAGYKGIILSGGPSSVYDDGAPLPDKRLFEAGIPVLGICYGMQAMGYLLGGKVVPAERREYGPARLALEREGDLLAGVKPSTSPPPGFARLASTENCPVAAMADAERRLYAVQFHPEVAHTQQGQTVLRNFLAACGARGDWSMASFIDTEVAAIRHTVGEDRVLCALSGGVDSSVVAVLIHKAIGDQLTCLFVDNGLLRQREAEAVVETFRK
jgi:GMP synthase (glutamine-hydrolysing)